MIYHDLTVTLLGDRTSRRKHDSRRLVRGAVEVFRDLLDRHGDGFREPIPVAGLESIDLQWTSEPPHTAAVATFWSGAVPVTTSALVSGRELAADKAALRGVQSLVVSLLPPGIEPGFDLLTTRERPAIVSVPLPFADPATMGLVADMETCLAAAFFESLQEGR